MEGKTIRELHQLLGPPQDDASAKQFQNWIVLGSDGGKKMLKILCPIRCDPTETPADIYYFVYETGTQKPVLVKRLSP